MLPISTGRIKGKVEFCNNLNGLRNNAASALALFHGYVIWKHAINNLQLDWVLLTLAFPAIGDVDETAIGERFWHPHGVDRADGVVVVRAERAACYMEG